MYPPEDNLEGDIRNLAHHIWRTAGNDFSRTALDFWVMAEQMVVELATDSARRATAAATIAAENASVWPTALRALYLYRIRELAHNMWTASTEQHERAMDYWLAAEKHLHSLAETAMRTAGASPGSQERLAEAFANFSSAAYLEQMRETAYQLWKAAGHQYGSALDFWLAAERQMLDSLTTTEATATSANSEKTNH